MLRRFGGDLSFGIHGAEQQDGSREVAHSTLRTGFDAGTMQEEDSSAELAFQARGQLWQEPGDHRIGLEHQNPSPPRDWGEKEMQEGTWSS